MSKEQENIIIELLQENKRLRARLAVLSAQKRQQDDLEKQFEESRKGITPELLQKLSPQAYEALMTMEFK